MKYQYCNDDFLHSLHLDTTPDTSYVAFSGSIILRNVRSTSLTLDSTPLDPPSKSLPEPPPPPRPRPHPLPSLLPLAPLDNPLESPLK